MQEKQQFQKHFQMRILLKQLLLMDLILKIYNMKDLNQMFGMLVAKKHQELIGHNTDGLVYVIDSADRKRLKECGEELQKLLEEKPLSGIPLLIYANKQDLVSALAPDEIQDSLTLTNIKDRQWSIVASSAKTQEGLQLGMEWIMDQIKLQSKF